jgi:dimethylamine corrinoid protein
MEKKQLMDELFNAIVACDVDLIETAGRNAIKSDLKAQEVIDIGVKAVSQVGREFEAGKIYIPELMLAGLGLEKVMKMAQKKILDEGGEVKHRGIIIIGAVKGDIHTIGKDLVATILRSRGFEVHDLGVDIPAARFASAAQEFRADIVGLSALMSTTLPAQREVLEIFKLKGIRDQHKILVGGGVCTQEWANEIGADAYAEDAARAATLVERLLS